MSIKRVKIHINHFEHLRHIIRFLKALANIIVTYASLLDLFTILRRNIYTLYYKSIVKLNLHTLGSSFMPKLYCKFKDRVTQKGILKLFHNFTFPYILRSYELPFITISFKKFIVSKKYC